MSKLPKARPAPDATMAAIGKTNYPWGICGFTGSLYAMYDKYPSKQGKIINASTRTWILVEILGFFIHLRSKNDPLIQEIEKFTRTFSPIYTTDDAKKYIEKFTVKQYMERLKVKINSSIGKTKDKTIERDYTIDVALTPQAVARYLSFAWKCTPKILTVDAQYKAKECIVGVRTSDVKQRAPYRGLQHYLYCDGKTVYSWGKTYKSIDDAMHPDTAHVVYVITI